MKRYFILIIAVTMLLSGCIKKPDNAIAHPTIISPTTTAPAQTTPPTEPLITVAQAPMCAISLPIIAEKETTEDGTLLFTHTYQNISMILQEPEIADKVIVDFLNRADTTQTAQQILDSAKSDYAQKGALAVPYHCRMTYAPMRLDNSILSLLGTSSSYSGGMHPETITKAVTYDLLTGNSLRCSAIFLETVTDDDLLPLIYDSLATQSASLYEDFESMVAEKFSQGIDQNNDWYFSPEGLCFFFSPYEIGPFASGTVIAQIPYEKLTNILRDIYFPAERDTAFGSIESIPYDHAPLEDYSQFAEVTVTPDSEKYLLVTESNVHDLKIIQQIPVDPAYGYSESYTIFAAYGLTPGDAIVLETKEPVKVQYLTGDQLITDSIPTA